MPNLPDIDSKIQVNSDGVRLGWNVLALLASVGLGLYVSSIVSPLENELEKAQDRYTSRNAEMVKEILTLEEKLKDLRNKYYILQKDDFTYKERIISQNASLQEKVTAVETSLSYVINDIKRIHRVLDSHGVGNHDGRSSHNTSPGD